MNRHRKLAVVLAGFCAFVPLYATQPLLPMLARLFHASAIEVSLTVTFATLGVALAAPLAGTIADRFGRKRIIVFSASALALVTMLAAAATNLAWLTFFRFLQGVFTPGIVSVVVAYIHEEWEPSSQGQAMAAYVSGTVVGGFSGRFVSGFVATHLNWQSVFLVLGALNLACAIALWRWLPQERAHIAAHSNAGLGPALDHLRNGRLLATYAVGFCVLFSLTSTFTYINFYLAAPPFFLLPAQLGSLFFVYLIGAAITPIAGRWIDRVGHRRALTVAVSAGSTGVLLTLVPQLWAVIAGLTVCCTGVFIAQASASGYLGQAARHNRALAVGLYGTFYYGGGSAGAAIPGFFWKSGGWPACVALIVLVQMTTVGLALSLWAKPGAGVHRPPNAEVATSSF